MTPYEAHAAKDHHMTRHSPDAFVIIEECETCGYRALHNPVIGYPVSMDYKPKVGMIAMTVASKETK